MTKLNELIAYLDTIAPPSFQESYDNAGLICGDVEDNIQSVLCCLDSTEAVIDEAIEIGANVVVAHHPIIFKGLKQLTNKNYIQRVIRKAIKNDIAIFAIHTNLDNVMQNGVNERIAQRLELNNLSILREKTQSNIQSPPIGSGIIGITNEPIQTEKFLRLLQQRMKVSVIKHTDICKETIQKVSICGGSGGFLLQDAIDQKADIFITADYKYHEYFDADGKIIIADIGHYESEQFTIDLLQELISKKFSNFAAQTTKVNTNPVTYLM